MKRIKMITAFFTISLTAFGQPKINVVLQKKIAQMFKEDQKWRKEYQNISYDKKSEYSEAIVNRNMTETDRSNMIEAKKIISKYGFPGFDLVGEGYSNDFWAIIQHCDDDVKFQENVLTLLSKQVKLKNASSQNYALLKDRVLLSTGKKQLYGTQVKYDQNGKTISDNRLLKY